MVSGGKPSKLPSSSYTENARSVPPLETSLIPVDRNRPVRPDSVNPMSLNFFFKSMILGLSQDRGRDIYLLLHSCLLRQLTREKAQPKLPMWTQGTHTHAPPPTCYRHTYLLLLDL